MYQYAYIDASPVTIVEGYRRKKMYFKNLPIPVTTRL